MGNESSLQNLVLKIKNSVEDVGEVEVVGLDMEDEREGVFEEAVEKACKVLGNLDAFVNCCAYEGML